MAMLNFKRKGDFLTLIDDSDTLLNSDLPTQYQSAGPFAHGVYEDFVDAEILKQVANEYPSREAKQYFDRDQERFKYQYHPTESDSILIQSLLTELNSDRMLKWLTKLTGIPNLIPDPYFVGGGLHETLQGGHLSIHADFNVHKPLRVQRRINLLIYLNENWLDSYGGHLELWDKEMKKCQKQILPTIAKAVIFNTDLDSYHGQPEPLKCPTDVTRKSIALYYYSVPLGGIENLKNRNTQFQTRSKTRDKTDWRVKVTHAVTDWVPLKLQPPVNRIIQAIFS